MFERVQHIGYRVSDLDQARGWFERIFGAKTIGRGEYEDIPGFPGPSRSVFMAFGQVEVQLIGPFDRENIPRDSLVLHHAGYSVQSLSKAVERLASKGIRFLNDTPFVDSMGRKVMALDPETTRHTRICLIESPAQDPPSVWGEPLIRVDGILHTGYRVKHLDEAIAWYTDTFEGVLLGQGKMSAGARYAMVNCNQAQVELVELPHAQIPDACHLIDHAGFVTGNLGAVIEKAVQSGLSFETGQPNQNIVGHKVIYVHPDHTLGTRIHLTELPPA